MQNNANAVKKMLEMLRLPTINIVTVFRCHVFRCRRVNWFYADAVRKMFALCCDLRPGRRFQAFRAPNHFLNLISVELNQDGGLVELSI